MERRTLSRRAPGLIAVVWLCAALPAGAVAQDGLPAQSEDMADRAIQAEEAAPAAQPPAVAGGMNKDEKSDAPAPELEAFLGTWVYSETLEKSEWSKSHQVDRYLLLKWRKGRLRVKTFDYYPELRTRGMESDWNGSINVDRWNVKKQTFTPMPDGTISVGLSGTNGIGAAAARSTWWAAGRLTIEEGEDGPVLRFETTLGYSPSSKGNAWQPLDRNYRLVSREIDPRFDTRRPR
jgi:hypothetical protein